MATEIERLILEVSATTKGLERGLNGLNKKVDAATARAEKSFARMNKNVLMSTTSLSQGIGTALAAVGVSYATQEVAAYADAWTQAKNKLAASGTEVSRMADVQADLVKTAIATRTALEPTVDLYAKIQRSTQTLGVSQAAVARATEIVNKSFKAGGAAASEQASGILQLGQALGSGVLQGDELRSLRENAPLLAKAIADEFGTTVAGLKKLGEEGKLTSDRVFRAIIKGGADIDRQFATTESTIGDAFTNLKTRAIEYVGNLNEATGASKAFIGMLEGVSENMDAFVDATIVGATILGGVFAGQAIAAAIAGAVRFAVTLGITSAAITAQGVAATASAASVRALTLAMSFFGGPIGIAIAAVAVAVGLIAYEANKAVPPTAALTDAVSTLDASLQAYEDASVAASTASGEARVKAIQEANALRVVAVEAREAARAKIELARATIAAASARLTELQTNAAAEGDGGVGAYLRAGSKTAPGPSSADAKQARADLEAGAAALVEADKRLTRIDEGLNRTMNPAAVVPDDKGGKGGKGGRGGPTAAELRQEADLEAARERGDQATIRRLEDQIDLKRRIDDYDQAGLSKAEATAAAQADQGRIAAARAEARARELGYMQEEVRLAAARAAGDDDLIRQLDRQIEIRERIRDYEELGKSTVEARAQAEADVAAIEAGRVAAMDRENAKAREAVDINAAELSGNIELARELQVQVDRREAIEAYQQRGLDLVGATAAAERDLAKIEDARAEARRTFWRDEEAAQSRRVAEAEGDVRRVRALAREEEIRSRTDRYRSEGNLGPAEARSRATSEVDSELVATARGQFRDAFRDGWKEALSGDFETFLADKAAAGLERAAEAGLNALADLAFDKFAEILPDLFGDIVGIGGDAAAGAAEGATIATAMTGAAATGAATLGAGVSGGAATGGAAIGLAITGAATTGAAAMGTAIAAAGATAAAAMAAAIATASATSNATTAISSFAGTGRAGGGYVRAGSSFPYNEFGREGFSPGFNGTIVPSDVLRALSQLKPGNYKGGGGGGDLRVKLENMGEPMTATARQDANGDTILRLEPMIDRAIENNARKGKLAKNLKKSPSPPRSF